MLWFAEENWYLELFCLHGENDIQGRSLNKVKITQLANQQPGPGTGLGPGPGSGLEPGLGSGLGQGIELNLHIHQTLICHVTIFTICSFVQHIEQIKHYHFNKTYTYKNVVVTGRWLIKNGTKRCKDRYCAVICRGELMHWTFLSRWWKLHTREEPQ